MSASKRLRAAKLRADLQSRRIGCEIVVLEETGSTNDVVREMANGDWPEGLAVFAEHQTGGRGQRGNRWESIPHKGVCFSFFVRPQIDLKDSARLSAWAAETVAQTITRVCRIEARTKMPNDVYVGGRKVAGVLVEMRAHPGSPHIAIVGIGLNVNHAATDFPESLRERATSLSLLLGGRVDRHRVAVELLRDLDRTYDELFD